MNKTDIIIKTIVPFAVICLIILDCFREDQILNPGLAIILTAIMTIYIVVFGITSLIIKANLIKASNNEFWEYKKHQYDWNLLLTSFSLLLISQIEVDGTLKYIFIVMGIIFFMGFIVKIYLSKKFKFQLVAINSNEIINIKESYSSYDIKKFKLKSFDNRKIEIKSRWHSFKIIENEFHNSDNMLDRLLELLKAY